MALKATDATDMADVAHAVDVAVEHGVPTIVDATVAADADASAEAEADAAMDEAMAGAGEMDDFTTEHEQKPVLKSSGSISSSVEESGSTLAATHTTKKDLPPPDPRPHLNVVFIGHVDAGKSTTCGNILFLSGEVDARTIEKYERDAKEKGRDTWYYAYILDINEEERNKGKTQEVGRATFQLPTMRLTILDAPGHKGLVPDMVSGAAQADIGVLIISARKGEFETGFDRGGQTREHALLAKTLGVNRLIVAVNKMDDPTCNWNQSRYEDICKKVTPYFKSCGFNPQRDISFVPIAGLQGHNLKYHVSRKDSPCFTTEAEWYTGPTLLEMLESCQPPPRNPDGPLRVPLLDGFRDGGVCTVGKIENGVAKTDVEYMVMPNRQKVKLIGVKVDDVDVSYANPGENVELRLVGIEDEQIHQGAVLCSIELPCPVVSKFTSQIVIVELLEHKPLITIGYSCVLHIHTACAEVVFEGLKSSIEQATRKKKNNPAFVKTGMIVECTLKLQTPICMESFEKLPQLGRFSLRDEGKTIAIGKVLSII